MEVDPNLLDLRFEQIGTSGGGSKLLHALTRPNIQYVVVADELLAGTSAKVVARVALIESLLAASIADADERRRWAALLEVQPTLLPFLIAYALFDGATIVGIIEGSIGKSSMVRAGSASLPTAMRFKVEGYLEERLTTLAPVPMIDAGSIAPEHWPDLSVILAGSQVAGVFDEQSLDVGGWRGGGLSAGTLSGSRRGWARAKPPARPVDFDPAPLQMPSQEPSPPQPAHVSREMQPPAVFYPPHSHASEQPGVAHVPSIAPSPTETDAHEADTAMAASVDETPQPFTAHPRITPENTPRAGKALNFLAGFSDRPDAEAESQQRIRIDDARSGETLLVVVSAQGASIIGESYAELPLDLAAEHRFTAMIGDDVKQVVLRAQYLFRNKLVGCLVKSLPVEQGRAEPPAAVSSASSSTPADIPATVGIPQQLADPETIEAIDLKLWVEKEKPGFVSWKAHVAATDHWVGPIVAPLEDSQKFARDLASLRGVYGDTGNGARDQLVGIGRNIAALIPQAIVDEVLTPALGSDRHPTIQLLTDEAFVPWELARLSGKQAGRDKPAFLGEIARIGRWWTGAASSGPQSLTRIEHFSAVAASQYGLATNRKTLKAAIEERAALHLDYAAAVIEACAAEVDPWLDRNPRLTGHLAHIALHGYSDAQANVQGLVLGDGAVLTPNRLAGEWDAGETPRFTMVFLNACQVGTGGEQLGRMAGFPGALVAGGVAAFVAPLWEVQDEIARDVSTGFYKRTLTDGVEVGEALRAMRAETLPGASITPWAYLFYGHPCLRLTRQQDLHSPDPQ